MWTVLKIWLSSSILISIGDHFPIVPSASLSLLIFHTQKYKSLRIQIHFHRNNYKMLYATVNTTSVTVTVCICHEKRQKQNEFALMNRTRRIFFCVACWLCYGRLFQPHHKWALMFHTFAAEESTFVWEHLVLTDGLFLPSSYSAWKAGDCLLCPLFFCSVFFHTPFLFSLWLPVVLNLSVLVLQSWILYYLLL